VEVRRATDASELPPALQLRCHRDGIGRLASAVEVEDRLENRLVCRTVEVRAADLLDHVRDRVLRQHHAAQDALLGGDVVRRHPVGHASDAGNGKLAHAHSRSFPPEISRDDAVGRSST